MKNLIISIVVLADVLSEAICRVILGQVLRQAKDRNGIDRLIVP